MVDFLRANPWCSREEYMWGMTVAQVRLASLDFSHMANGSAPGKDDGHTIRIETADDLKRLNEFGIPMI